jgi:hypothetical protein
MRAYTRATCITAYSAPTLLLLLLLLLLAAAAADAVRMC